MPSIRRMRLCDTLVTGERGVQIVPKISEAIPALKFASLFVIFNNVSTFTFCTLVTFPLLNLGKTIFQYLFFSHRGVGLAQPILAQIRCEPPSFSFGFNEKSKSA